MSCAYKRFLCQWDTTDFVRNIKEVKYSENAIVSADVSGLYTVSEHEELNAKCWRKVRNKRKGKYHQHI